jgi:hypothetical protein
VSLGFAEQIVNDAAHLLGETGIAQKPYSIPRTSDVRALDDSSVAKNSEQWQRRQRTAPSSVPGENGIVGEASRASLVEEHSAPLAMSGVSRS